MQIEVLMQIKCIYIIPSLLRYAHDQLLCCYCAVSLLFIVSHGRTIVLVVHSSVLLHC